MRSIAFALMLAFGAAAHVHADEPLIFPQPKGMRRGEGSLAVDARTSVVVLGKAKGLRGVGEILARELGTAVGPEGRPLRVIEVADADDDRALRGIILDVRPDAAGKTPGAYRLRVHKAGAHISGRDPAGVYYGTLTLLQLFKPTGGGKGEIACAEITDAPYHKYRGIRAHLPRGKPREGEITHDQFRAFLRMAAFCRLNHIWVQGTSWCLPMRRHPECAWQNVCTREQADAFVDYARKRFLSMDGSLGWNWVYYKYKHLAELYEDETWDDMKKKVRRVCRVNVCPSNPETWKMLTETTQDICEVLPGDHFCVPFDEMYQEYHGSRWAVCPRCKGKDPVKLWADMVNRVIAEVLRQGKIPILSGGMLLREHQGHYKDIYKAIDMLENRDKIVIYNWSEGAIRRGAMVRAWGGKPRDEYRVPDLKTTPFFRKHGYKDVMHLFAGNNQWHSRPEMREVNGKLECYGGFVSYYHAMDPQTFKQKGTLGNLAFTAQHLWTPNDPEMDSPTDEKACRYAEALCESIFNGASYLDAIAVARKVAEAPAEATLVEGKAVGRRFESKSAPVNLFAKARGERTEGTMALTLPVEEANPGAAFLELTLHDWDQTGEGEIFLNGHKVDLAVSRKSNGRDYTFEPVKIDPKRLKFGPDPNKLRFVYKATAGFIAKKAAIILVEK